MFRLTQTPILGQSQQNEWSQVVVNTTQNVVCSFSVRGTDASLFGHRFLDEISHSAPTSALDFHQMIEKYIGEASQLNLVLECSAGFFLDEKCILITFEGRILLRRQKKVGQLLHSEAELKVIEGSTKVQDVFIFSTAHADVLTEEVQRLLQSGSDAELLTSSLVPLLAMSESPGLIAISYVELQDPNSDPNSATSSHIKKAQKKIALSRLFISSVPQKTSTIVRKLLTPPIVFILLFLLGSIVAATLYFHVTRTKQMTEAATLIAPIETKMEGIKKNASQDPLGSRQQTEEVISQLELLLPTMKSKPITVHALQEELDKVRGFYNTISGKQEINILPTFFDLRLVQSDFLASKIAFSDQTLLFLDTGKKKLLSLDVTKKQPLDIPIGDVGQAKDFSYDSKNIFVLSNGIYQVNIGQSLATASSQIKTEDDANRDAQYIRMYGKNIYIFNKSKSTIYRYAPSDVGGYSAPITWLRPDQSVDLSTVSSFAVDGDIWVTNQNGKIHRFSAGQEVPFVSIGLKDDFTTPTTLFTNENLNNIYVLEPQKNRIVVLKKTGEFLNEIKSDNLATATALVANEQLQKIYVLSGSLVYEISL